MALSPLDIKNKSFPTKMRGYNQEEVDDFLDQVIADYEDALRDKRELEKNLKHADEKLTYFNELKDALNQSIIVAQDTADKLKNTAVKESDVLVSSAGADAKAILTKAQEEADRTTREANQKAEEIMRNATQNASQLAHETDDLKKKTREFHRSLALLLESQLEIVKSKDWDNLLQPFANYIGDDHSAVRELLEKEVDNKQEVSVESEGHTQAIEISDLVEQSNVSESSEESIEEIRKSMTADDKSDRKDRKSRRDR